MSINIFIRFGYFYVFYFKWLELNWVFSFWLGYCNNVLSIKREVNIVFYGYLFFLRYNK